MCRRREVVDTAHVIGHTVAAFRFQLHPIDQARDSVINMMRRAGFLLAAFLVLGAVAATAGQRKEPPAAPHTRLCSPLTLTGANGTTVSPGDTITASGTAATGGASIAIVL